MLYLESLKSTDARPLEASIQCHHIQVALVAGIVKWKAEKLIAFKMQKPKEVTTCHLLQGHSRLPGSNGPAPRGKWDHLTLLVPRRTNKTFPVVKKG